MKNVLNVILFMLITGCTSSIAVLQTDKPNNNQYEFVFGKMLIDYKQAKSLTPETREANYEKQLNNVLKKDKTEVDPISRTS